MKYSDSANFSRLNWPSPCCLNRPALWLAASVWKSRLNFFLFYGYTSQPTPLDIFSYFLWFSQAVPVRCQWKSSQTEPKRGKLTIQKDNRMVIACSKRITSGIHTFLYAPTGYQGLWYQVSDLIAPGFSMKPVLFREKRFLRPATFMVSRFSVLTTISHVS